MWRLVLKKLLSFTGAKPEELVAVICPTCKLKLNSDQKCDYCQFQSPKAMPLLSRDDYFFNNLDRKYPQEFTPELEANAIELLRRVNNLLQDCHKLDPSFVKPTVTSGWRPSAYNKLIGGSPNSRHITCRAIDLHDPSRKWGNFIVANRLLLDKHDLAMESLADTDNARGRWVHLQYPPPPSGNRIFKV
jgi:hypothetical protein